MSPIARREFVGGLAAAAAFTIVPRRVLGRGYRAPSDTLNIACIGVGGMGRNDVRGVSGENLYALCDVDWERAAEAFTSHPDARRYHDFREMLEKDGDAIDAVTVSTPDHTHTAAAILALKLGKHVFCQKPLARTVGEVRALEAEAARRPAQATQMGNQGHAGAGTRQIREWVEAGVIGTVREVHLWTDRPIWPQGLDRPTDAHHLPPHFHWDLWLGPAAMRPFHPAYAPFRWRGWWDFGTGALGDIACHAMDAAFWTLDLGFPTSIAVESTALFEETAPESSRIVYHFAARGARPAVTVVWLDGGLRPACPPEVTDAATWPPWRDGGQLWIGDDGKLVADMYGRNPRVLDAARHAELTASPPPEKYPRVESVYAEWIAACRSGSQGGSAFATHAGPLTEMVLLGNLAVRAGRTLELDPASGAVRGATIPQEWVSPSYREGWSL